MGDGSMQHGHAHGASAETDRRALTFALVLLVAFMAFEVGAAIYANSLALLADAGHLATDMASLALALFALHLADREPTPSKTFGYRRTEILAALANGTALGVVAVFIALEAVERLGRPTEVRSGLMLAVAGLGLAANLYAGAVLFRSNTSRVCNAAIRPRTTAELTGRRRGRGGRVECRRLHRRVHYRGNSYRTADSSSWLSTPRNDFANR